MYRTLLAVACAFATAISSGACSSESDPEPKEFNAPGDSGPVDTTRPPDADGSDGDAADDGLPTEVGEVDASFLGVNTIWPPGTRDAWEGRFERADALGIEQVRMGLEWRKVEAERGTYDWESADRLFRLAEEHDIELLPVVHFPPEWATVDEPKPDGAFERAPSEEAYQDYGDFLVAAIERYGPDGSSEFGPVKHWQVWNEPNNDDFWAPSPDPAAWTQFMRTVDDRLRQAELADDVEIVHAGLSKPDVRFLQDLWEEDDNYGERFDIMAVHAYTYYAGGIRHPTEMDEDDPEYADQGYVGSLDQPGYFGKVFNLQRLMKTEIGETRPIWITEFGYFVGDTTLGVSAERQATLLKDCVRYTTRNLTEKPFGMKKRDLPTRVERMYWFVLDDYADASNRGTFGLYTQSGDRRPSADEVDGMLP